MELPVGNEAAPVLQLENGKLFFSVTMAAFLVHVQEAVKNLVIQRLSAS